MLLAIVESHMVRFAPWVGFDKFCNPAISTLLMIDACSVNQAVAAEGFRQLPNDSLELSFAVDCADDSAKRSDLVAKHARRNKQRPYHLLNMGVRAQSPMRCPIDMRAAKKV